MKIIVGTPRSGTSFTANWYANEYPHLQYMMPGNLGEYFHPDFFDTSDVDTETVNRLTNLPEQCIFKLHTGKEMSEHIWKFVYDHPVILVKRRDLLGQFISYGIGYTTNNWVNFSAENRNGLAPDETFHYHKHWFDELVQRLHELKLREKNLKIERTVWFEDLENYTNNGKLPRRQNYQSNEEKMKLVVNADELSTWVAEFVGDYEI
jgi:hypothetical protein